MFFNNYLFIFITTCIMNIQSFHLTFNQYNSIINLIQNPQITVIQREKLNKILFYSYEKWAISKANEFRKIHVYKTQNIKRDELYLYSKIGLYKSILNYNGKSRFINYSSIYVKSELYKAITDYYSISIIPKKDRIKTKSNFTSNELIAYKKLLNTKLISYDNNWQFDKIYNPLKNNDCYTNIIEKENLTDLWNKINCILDTYSLQVFNYKYNIEFKKIKSNKAISELMCCSEEKIRKNLSKSKIIIKQNILQPFTPFPN